MQNRHLIAALIAMTPVAAFAQASAPGTPPAGGVSSGGATETTPPIQTTQDPSTGRATPGTIPETGTSTQSMQTPDATMTTPTMPPEDAAATTGEGAKPKKTKKPR